MGLPMLGTWMRTPELIHGAETTEPQSFKGHAEEARNISAAATQAKGWKKLPNSFAYMRPWESEPSLDGEH